MSDDGVALLFLAGLVVVWLFWRRGRSAPAMPDQVTRIEASLANLDARLRALEQWAAETPNATFQRTLPPSAPPLATTQAPLSLPAGSPSNPYIPPSPPIAADAATAQATPVVPAGMVPVAAMTVGTTAASAAAIVDTPELPPASPPSLPPAIPPAPAQPAWSFADLEQLLSGRGLAWLGGLAILIGALFFLGLAFTRGWIGPGPRVRIGLGAGMLMAAGGAWFFERREALFGHVLVAVGLGTITMSLVAATRLYSLVPASLGLLAALITAIAATLIAIRADSQVVAAYGLVAALAAPPLLGAEPTLTTITFLAVALLGTTTIALFRTWNWLPVLAFAFAAPQLGVWLTDGAGLGVGLAALTGFGILNGIAAGGEEFRRPRKRLYASSATLLLTNAAFLLGVGFAFLGIQGIDEGRGLYLLILALVHFALGGYFLADQGERHPFGMLAFGTGIAALTMAIPVQLGGPVVPLAWAAEATALAWVYTRRAHGYSGFVACILGLLTLAHLGIVEYPFWQIESVRLPATPFINANGGTLGFVLLALIVAGVLARSWPIRALLAAIGSLLVLYALPFELGGLPLITGWALLCVGTLAAAAFARENVKQDRDLIQIGLLFPALLAGMLALFTMFAFELPVDRIGTPPSIPFVDRQTAAATILIVASLAGGFAARLALARRIGIIAAAALAAYLMPFELRPAGIVVAWALLALLLGLIGRRDPQGSTAYLTAGGVLLGVGLLVVLGSVAPPDRLTVTSGSRIDHPPFWSGATAALAALIAVLVLVARLYPAHRIVRWGTVLAGVLGVYLLSIGVVDIFQRRGQDEAQIVSIARQAQVALSILWAMLGGATFIIGVARWRIVPRTFGLGLLALATVKVFLYDLASLDASYKVLSFIGLGILLLASSYAYQRLKPRVPPASVPQPEA